VAIISYDFSGIAIPYQQSRHALLLRISSIRNIEDEDAIVRRLSRPANHCFTCTRQLPHQNRSQLRGRVFTFGHRSQPESE